MIKNYQTSIFNLLSRILMIGFVFVWGTSLLTYADYFMVTDHGVSAKTIGQGYVEGFLKDSSTLFENPAGLYRVPSGSISFFTSRIMDEVAIQNISFAWHTSFGKIGYGYMENVVSAIPQTASENGRFVETGVYDYRNAIHQIAYHYSLSPQFHLGAAYLFYLTSLETVYGHGSNLNLGVIWEMDRFTTSFFIRNLIPNKVLYSNRKEEQLPFQSLLSLKYALPQWDIVFQFKNERDFYLASLGTNFIPGEFPFLRVTGGYREFLSLSKKKNSVTLGVEVEVSPLTFYIAYEKSEHLLFDNKMYFSTALSF